MKRARSTTTPTKEEAAWIVAVKEGPCLACLVRLRASYYGCDYHHLKSGNRRRGHMFGIGLCAHHHRGVPFDGMTQRECRDLYGPSLMDGGKTFSAEYGTDDELLSLQKRVLGKEE